MILIVDDDESVLDAIGFLMEFYKIPTIKSKTVLKAVQIIKSQKIDMVLADVVLLDGDIKMIIDECHSKYQNIKIILMSAMCPKKLEQIAKAFKVDNFLSKPFELEQFENVILDQNHS